MRKETIASARCAASAPCPPPVGAGQSNPFSCSRHLLSSPWYGGVGAIARGSKFWNYVFGRTYGGSASQPLLSARADKSGISDVDRALVFIRDFQHVIAATPFIFRPDGLIKYSGDNVLNISTRRVLEPAPGPAVWGPDGKFPWHSKYWESLYTTREQLEVMLAHTAYAYQAAHKLQPCSGQAVFTCGGVGVGKTYLGTGMISTLFGGFREGTKYFAGQDSFGGEIAEYGVVTVDDSVLSNDPHARRIFFQNVKKFIANQDLPYHKKFQNNSMTKWQGRFYGSLNDDPSSLVMLPDADMSNRDKLILVRAVETPKVEFPPELEFSKLQARELPFLARYLLDYKIPEALRGSSRFGIKAYAEPSLLQLAQQVSPTASFQEGLEDWRNTYFQILKPEALFWEGTSFQLLGQLLASDANEIIFRGLKPEAVTRHLYSLMQRELRWIQTVRLGASQGWRIYRSEPHSQLKAT